MTNPRVQLIIDDCNMAGIKSPEAFAQQIVGETVTAILATDTRDIVHTTFDKQLVDGAISRVVDSVRNHWNFK
jgi:hypothetical protein